MTRTAVPSRGENVAGTQKDVISQRPPAGNGDPIASDPTPMTQDELDEIEVAKILSTPTELELFVRESIRQRPTQSGRLGAAQIIACGGAADAAGTAGVPMA